MKKLLYTATKNNGKEVSSYIEANSNKEALESLSDKGFSNIEFQDDVVTAISRSDLDDLSENELEQVAKFEAAIRVKPSFITFILNVFRVNKLLILGGICFLIWGVVDSSSYLITFGLILSLSMPLLSIWNYRVVNRYDKLLRAYATGKTEAVAKLTESLRKHMKQPEMAFDLDIRMASINAHHGDVEKEIEKIEKWRAIIDELSPGMFESRVASIYHLHGSYNKFVEAMRNAFFISSLSPTLVLDLALAEARLGESEKAEILLKKVKPEELPIHGIPFINWVEGAVGCRKGIPEAEDKLKSAISGLLAFGDNPAIWPSLAVCIGDYALCVNSEASRAKSKDLLSTVWDILKFHGERELIAQLVDKYPSLKA